MNQNKAVSTTDEDELLLDILKTTGTPSSKLPTQHFTSKLFKKILTQANLHGIIPQLYKTLKDHSNIADGSMQVLHQDYTRIVQANLLLTAHLLTVTKALEKHSFNYLSIKGPTLSQELYGDISMRQFSDIDLFVEEKDMVEIAELLITLGYEPIFPLSLLTRQKFLKLDNDFSFRHSKTNALLELHWKLFPLRHKMPLDFTELHRHSQNIKLQNREIKTLSPQDNLLYLSLHGAKHIFERYEWVYDLDQLIRTYPDLDLMQLYRSAKEIHLEVPFLLGVFLSHLLFKTPIPKEFESYKTAHIQSLIDSTVNYYGQGFVHWDESDKKRARFLFLSDLFQNKESKSIWLFKSLFKTTPVDVITFNLPDSLAFLYPVLRPFRLLYKHLFTKKPVYA